MFLVLGRDLVDVPWYHAAPVPAAHRQSVGLVWLQLAQQVRKVQTIQFWGVPQVIDVPELQGQVPAVPRRL